MQGTSRLPTQGLQVLVSYGHACESTWSCSNWYKPTYECEDSCMPHYRFNNTSASKKHVGGLKETITMLNWFCRHMVKSAWSGELAWQLRFAGYLNGFTNFWRTVLMNYVSHDSWKQCNSCLILHWSNHFLFPLQSTTSNSFSIHALSLRQDQQHWQYASMHRFVLTKNKQQ